EQDTYNLEEFNEFDTSNNNDLIQNIKENLDKKDEEVQYKKLQTVICCREKCLQNSIAHNHAVENYQKFQNLNNNQKDMFLLEILSATTQKATIKEGQKCNSLLINIFLKE
ncbi:24116_t:CDS:2, partial [Gigaspora margarita]